MSSCDVQAKQNLVAGIWPVELKVQPCVLILQTGLHLQRRKMLIVIEAKECKADLISLTK